MMTFRFFRGSARTPRSASGSPSTIEQVGVGARGDGAQLALLEEQLGIGRRGRADDGGRRIQSRSHLEFAELRFPGLGAPQVGAEGDRQAVLLCPLVDLPALRDGLLEIADDRVGKMGLRRALDALDERYECRVEVDAALGHHRHRLPAHEIGVLDGAHASPKASPDPLVGVDMRHDVGAASRRLLDGGLQFRLRELVERRVRFRREDDAA